MLPSQLKPGHFAGYPPRGRQVAASRVELLRQLPLSFVPLLLREVIAYDWKFPAERQEVDAQFAYLRSLSQEGLTRLMGRFAGVKLSRKLEGFDWVQAPAVFSEQLSAYLWATHQIGAFRTAAVEFMNAFRAATPQAPPSMARLVIVVIGQGVSRSGYALFRRLRPHGAYFTQVNPEKGWRTLLEAAAARAKAYPALFAHWYIEGGSVGTPLAADLTWMSYDSMAAVRAAVVARMRNQLQTGKGADARRTALALTRPEDVGLKGEGDDGVLNHFKLSVLSEGSGTQFFSTTFVQWSAREALRRAQPLTLLARFAPRQTERSMNEMLAGTRKTLVLDPEGALVDADMGAYYTWLNQRRLPGAADSSFLVWFEDHTEALVISRSVTPRTESSGRIEMSQLLEKALS